MSECLFILNKHTIDERLLQFLSNYFLPDIYINNSELEKTTALHLLILFKNEHYVSAFLKKFFRKIDFSVRDAAGKTPLMVSCSRHSNMNISKMLFDAAIDSDELFGTEPAQRLIEFDEAAHNNKFANQDECIKAFGDDVIAFTICCKSFEHFWLDHLAVAKRLKVPLSMRDQWTLCVTESQKMMIIDYINKFISLMAPIVIVKFECWGKFECWDHKLLAKNVCLNKDDFIRSLPFNFRPVKNVYYELVRIDVIENDESYLDFDFTKIDQVEDLGAAQETFFCLLNFKKELDVDKRIALNKQLGHAYYYLVKDFEKAADYYQRVLSDLVIGDASTCSIPFKLNIVVHMTSSLRYLAIGTQNASLDYAENFPLIKALLKQSLEIEKAANSDEAVQNIHNINLDAMNLLAAFYKLDCGKNFESTELGQTGDLELLETENYYLWEFNKHNQLLSEMFRPGKKSTPWYIYQQSCFFFKKIAISKDQKALAAANMGYLLMDTNPVHARKHFASALKLYQEFYKIDHLDIAHCLYAIGLCMMKKHKFFAYEYILCAYNKYCSLLKYGSDLTFLKEVLKNAALCVDKFNKGRNDLSQITKQELCLSALIKKRKIRRIEGLNKHKKLTNRVVRGLLRRTT